MDSPSGFSGDSAQKAPERRFPTRLATLLVIALFLASTALAYEVGSQAGPGNASAATPSSALPVLLSINNPFDTANNSTMDQYAPANFSVPSNTLLEFILVNYDGGLNEPAAQYTNVNGTLNDCIYFESTSAGLGPCSHSLSASRVAHTFTVPALHLNVPVPAASTTPGGAGATVIFFATFATPGTYTWLCMAPCDPASMATPGFMQGTITVT